MSGDGFFSLGEMIAGGGIDREGARLEGLDAGSKINARRATTANALAQARLRVDEQENREGLADAIESMGLPRELSVAIRAGVDPKQLTGAQLEQQEFGNRANLADIAVSPEQRLQSAQAIEVPKNPFQFGPGGDLFADVFNPGAAPELSATGPAAVGADEALAQQRIASAKLSDERREHPDRFKASTTVNVNTTPLAEQILPGGQGESVIPPNFKAEEGLGAEAFLKGGTNALTDFLGLGVGFPDEAQANAVLGEVSARIQIAMRADVFRPNQQIQDLLARYAEDPRQLFRGGELGRQNFMTTLTSMKRSRSRIQDQLNSPTKKTPTRQGRLEQGLFALADTIADLEDILESFKRTDGPAPTELNGPAPAQAVEIGGVIQLPGGGTATRIE